jgi:hypothetical protein
MITSIIPDLETGFVLSALHEHCSYCGHGTTDPSVCTVIDIIGREVIAITHAHCSIALGLRLQSAGSIMYAEGVALLRDPFESPMTPLEAKEREENGEYLQ